MNEGPVQATNPPDRRRRRLSAGLCLGLIAAIAGCGGSLDESEPSAATPAWDVVPSRALALAPGGAFDLAATLPATVAPGGVFEVDTSGAPLPPGITLTPKGLLSVSASASGGTAGVVFRYTPPA